MLNDLRFTDSDGLNHSVLVMKGLIHRSARRQTRTNVVKPTAVSLQSPERRAHVESLLVDKTLPCEPTCHNCDHAAGLRNWLQ